MSWTERIPEKEITEKITKATVDFAERFGTYLADKNDNAGEPLTTSQLRKFFGEVKRQQMNGYEEGEFVMLKPKLAYAVGRAKAPKKTGTALKIEDFNNVIADAIDKVIKSSDKKKAFDNFISVFEAIVAYHKAAEKK
jgi:CRISPR type III-A-associated protein Csm2